MKKIYTLATLLLVSTLITKAADDDKTPLKNFRFGIKAVPVITWIQPDDIKQFKNAGIKLKFNYGLTTEFKLTKTAVFATGFDFNTYGGKIEFQNNTTKYDVPDLSTTDSAVSFLITSRTYSMKTYELPLTLKLRTPEIGSMTYFGMFGINVGVRGKVKANDDGKYVSLVTKTVNGVASTKTIEDATITRPDNIITKDMNLFRLGLNVGIGAEYNLAGSTSLVVSINYFNAFLNTLKNTSKTLQTLNTKSTKYEYISQNVKSNALAINIGFMF
jgi:Outer membrane protein beta-barrel domain